MTMVPMMVRCEKCHKKYMFNPDVGRNIVCPHCFGTGTIIDKSKKLFRWRKKDAGKE